MQLIRNKQKTSCMIYKKIAKYWEIRKKKGTSLMKSYCNIDNNDQIATNYQTPEHINNSEQTAPSKYIIRIYREYQKVVNGTAIAQVIGMETMIKQCPHFAEWINKMRE